MAGLYPDSHNVKEYRDILYNKVNPTATKSARWEYNHPEVAQYTGKVPELQYFDAQFFKVHNRLGNSMDSMGRKILEQAFDAIYDAGLSPEQLSGTKVGVYVGTCFSETEKACFYVVTSRTGFGIPGCSKTMFANRISYWLNAKGPSMSVDQACCSSTVALDLAYQAIMHGEIDCAIVGGANLCLHPHSSVHYGRIMPISKDGKTKSFDKDASGCTRSEAINVLFLQKAKDALRVYAEVIHIKSEFSGLIEGKNGPKYGFYREPNDLAVFLNNFYKEANVPPQAVKYVEAVGSATPEADKAELDALDKVFCENRDDPLFVGSVMSNIGYGEAASGVSAITKVLLGYENGKLAANLNCENPRNDVDALRNGKIRIVTEHQPFGGGYAAVNGLSVTGVNAHVLLRGLNKPKDLNRYKSNIPHLVTISGRQQSGVEKILEDLKSRPIDPEELALFHNIHQTRISGHLGRGFIILDTNENNETVSISQKANYFDDAARPLWFVYSGMGSQWAGMGAQLMRIPVFATAIKRCHKVLEPKGVDLINIITSSDKKIFDNILHSFVGIAATQIGLTDVLTELGIVPDKIIGHSVGELGCAYADGCLTAEETILSAYSRGLVSVQTPFIKGSMAAVGIGYQQISKMCPPEIEVACHNSSESCTISGPADIMNEFVESLTAKGIFAKEVPCSNIAYHSKYIADAGPGLLKYLSEVIKTPRLRTERWVSTSIPEERWGEPLAKYSSAEYHTNNLLNPVLFEETSHHIPKNAVLVEVAPHGLLQAILKRSLPNCTNIPLTRRGHADNVVHLLEAIGNLYMEGYNPKVQALYPKVEFPVSTGTPMLGHLIEWAHVEKWNLPLYVSAHRKMASACNFVLSVHDDDHSYLSGHIIKGKNYYPFSAALVAVWDTLAMSLGMKKKSISVQFQNVLFQAQPLLHNRRQLRLSVALHRGNGQFEVTNESIAVATGSIKIFDKGNDQRLYKLPVENKEPMTLQAEDIYKLLYTRDYHYRDDFRSIIAANQSLTKANIHWKKNWVTFIDGLLQLNALRVTNTSVSQLDSMRNMTINIEQHKIHVDANVLTADVLEVFDCTRCGGIIIENLRFFDLPMVKTDGSVINHLKFIPHITNNQLDETSALSVLLQIVRENVNNDKITAIKIYNNSINASGTCAVTVKTESDLSHLRCLVDSLPLHQRLLVFAQYPPLPHLKSLVNLFRIQGRIFNLYMINEELNGDNLIEDLPASDLAIYVLDHGVWGGKYYVPRRKLYCTGQSAMLQSSIVGRVESLKWFETPKVFDSGMCVQVHYAGINDLDVKRAFGVISFGENNMKSYYGMDFSGVTQNGTKVMGLIKGGSVSSQIKANPNLLWPVPEHWTLEDAATVPLAYCMAFYALNNRARFYPGIRVLIHCGTGALGQAAISICLAHNCEVYTTVSDCSKKHFLKKLFPQLKEENIGNSRDVTFGDMILSNTKGLGCEIVLGGLKGELKNVSLKCCASSGITIDTTLITNREEFNFGMQMLTKDRSFKTINFSSIFEHGAEQEMKQLQLQLSEGISRGYVRPLTRIVYAPDEVTRAFNLVANSKHRGRVLIDMKQDICVEKARYFAVINNDNVIGEQVISTRERDGKPATLIKLPSLLKDKYYDGEHQMSIRSAIDAVEEALLSQEAVSQAQLVSADNKSLLDEITKWAGVKLPTILDENLTLSDFDMDLARAQLVQAGLRNEYNISFREGEIPNLTIKRIRKIEEMLYASEFKDTTGLDTFYSYVDSDELLATTEMAFLSTLTNSSSMRHEEFDSSQKFLCIIPGVEGHYKRFSEMCETLKLPALVLQPGLSMAPKETLQDIAVRFAETLLKQTELKDNFYLLGYESGVIIALEMAAILEEHGLTGVVYCIGGAPKEIQMQFTSKLQQFQDETSLQEAVGRHMVEVMLGQCSASLEKSFEKAQTWKEKVDICVRDLRGRVNHSAQYARELIETAYSRIVQVRNYSSKPQKLRSLLILMKPDDWSTKFSDKSSLRDYSLQPIVEYQLKAPLAYATQDLRCAGIINRHLDEEILKAFEHKNTCETYLLNADTFMTIADV
ncbi:fatty acid synthase-like [Zerene cesonia]|uniref:fatty acid synthase-like n=1 Tax=Zerene cesonia TaxID=33412 RepID=UPI0018E561AB|nr:fatty acid synthase-like [Zerene cesonia]